MCVVQHSIAAPGFDFGLPRPQDLTIHLASSDGRLVCIRSVDAPRLDPDKIRAALRLERPTKSAEATTQPAAPEAPATSRPADAPGLGTKAPDRPVGGKSKVSKAWGSGG
jgi:hypothetical protein